MDSVVTLDWEPAAGGVRSVAVPLSSRNFVALASSLWAERPEDVDLLESAAADVDVVVALIAIVEREARARAVAGADSPDEPVAALLHQVRIRGAAAQAVSSQTAARSLCRTAAH